MQTLSGWVTLTENRAARVAVDRVVACLSSDSPRRVINPLFLHGPAGLGKTHLVQALVEEVLRGAPDREVCVLVAADLKGLNHVSGSLPEELAGARNAHLLALEDVQHLPDEAVETTVALLDRALATHRQVVCTASEGPARLTRLPARLTSRLASGLVVGLSPLGPMSRRSYFRERLARQPLPFAVPREVLDALADRTAGSVRQLEGALTRLEALGRLHGRAPTLEEINAAFGEDGAGRRPTVERIVQKVGSYYQLEPRQLRSRRRGSQARGTLLARQVGMYLARQLTGLSLEQIGAYFGGRDHSTVLHACRKVEQALTKDPALSGAVRQLHADLA